MVTWYCTKTAGMFQEGRYYRNDQLGVLGRMARKVGILVLADPPAARLAAPPEKPVKPRKRAPRKATNGEAPV